VGSGDDDSTGVRKMFQGFDEIEGTGGIQSSRWFIKIQDTWVPEHLNTDADSPAFSTRTPAFPASAADSGIRTVLEAEFENDLLNQLAALLGSEGGWESKGCGVDQGLADGEGRKQHINLCNIGAGDSKKVEGSIITCASSDSDV